MPAPMNEYVQKIALEANRLGASYVHFEDLHNLTTSMSCAHPNTTGLYSWGIELAGILGAKDIQVK